MTEEPYEPRKDDHLVEPMFAGLGVGEERADEEEGEQGAEAEEGAWRAVVRFVRRLLGKG